MSLPPGFISLIIDLQYKNTFTLEAFRRMTSVVLVRCKCGWGRTLYSHNIPQKESDWSKYEFCYTYIRLVVHVGTCPTVCDVSINDNLGIWNCF